MTSIRNRAKSLSVVVAVLAAAGQAFGGLSLINYRPSECTIDFSSLPEQVNLSNPLSLSYAGGTAEFSITDGSFQRWTQTSGWDGAFVVGDAVLWTANGTGALTIEFSSGISAFATQIQSNIWGAGTASIWAYDASDKPLGTFAISSVIESYGDDSATLIGVEVTSSSPISRIVLDIDGFAGEDFGINRISVTPVPVPGAVLLGMLGLSTAGLKLRRRHGEPSER
jgi:hypothetical protein